MQRPLNTCGCFGALGAASSEAETVAKPLKPSGDVGAPVVAPSQTDAGHPASSSRPAAADQASFNKGTGAGEGLSSQCLAPNDRDSVKHRGTTSSSEAGAPASGPDSRQPSATRKAKVGSDCNVCIAHHTSGCRHATSSDHSSQAIIMHEASQAHHDSIGGCAEGI